MFNPDFRYKSSEAADIYHPGKPPSQYKVGDNCYFLKIRANGLNSLSKITVNAIEQYNIEFGEIIKIESDSITVKISSLSLPVKYTCNNVQIAEKYLGIMTYITGLKDDYVRPLVEQQSLDQKQIASNIMAHRISCVFKDPMLNFCDILNWLGSYYPKHLNRFNKEINENHDAFSSFILGLKEQYEFFIQHFYNRIKPKLSDKEFVIVVVPPHTQGNGCNTGIGILARRLSGGNIIDGTKSLYRHKEINKLSSGGDREEIIHMRSIRVDVNGKIKGRKIGH